MWVEAIDLLMSKLHGAGLTSQIRAISGAAQQHGSVYWSQGGVKALGTLNTELSLCDQLRKAEAFAVLNSPIWEDSSTQVQCRQIESVAGGKHALARISGSAAFERFTGPQILAIKYKRPSAWARVARISLVSSFVASLLSGEIVPIDFSDASGTNLIDIRSRQWSRVLCDAVDPALVDMLGADLAMANQTVGSLSPFFAAKYDMPSCAVVSFTGDNPSTYAGFEKMLIGDRYIAMLCYKNGSLAREWVRDNCLPNVIGSWADFDAAAAAGPLAPESFGVYYCLSEILPRSARGIYRFKRTIASASAVQCPSGRYYMQVQDFSDAIPSNTDGKDCRAILESQFMSMRLDHSRKSDTPLSAVIVTGGASANPVIRQAMADILGVPVFAAGVLDRDGFRIKTLAMPAYGGAIRAMAARSSPPPSLDIPAKQGQYLLQKVCTPSSELHVLYSEAMDDFAYLRGCIAAGAQEHSLSDDGLFHA
ncbi:hypothetical protein GGI02_005275 [Coemansia sp. RSA 2322]|nr:hypothetical protein GGI02_005275 [Coemansia sp. RSA 2322]